MTYSSACYIGLSIAQFGGDMHPFFMSYQALFSLAVDIPISEYVIVLSTAICVVSWPHSAVFFFCVCVCVCFLLVSNYLFRVRQKVIQNYAGSWAFFLSFATFFLMFCSLLTFPFSNFCCSSYAFTFLLPCCTFTEVLPIFHHLSTSKTN